MQAVAPAVPRTSQGMSSRSSPGHLPGIRSPQPPPARHLKPGKPQDSSTFERGKCKGPAHRAGEDKAAASMVATDN